MLEQLSILENNREFWWDVEKNLYDCYLTPAQNEKKDFNVVGAVDLLIRRIERQISYVKNAREDFIKSFDNLNSDAVSVVVVRYHADVQATYDKLLWFLYLTYEIINKLGIVRDGVKTYSLQDKVEIINKLSWHADVCCDNLAIQIESIVSLFEKVYDFKKDDELKAKIKKYLQEWHRT